MDIVLMADKGGVGKSTLSVHLAARCAHLGLDTALVDLDGRQGSSHWLARTAETLTIYRLGDTPADSHAVRVIDTPAHPSAPMRQQLLDQADVVVIVSVPAVYALMAARDLFAQAAPQTTARVGVLINNVHPARKPGPLKEELTLLGIDYWETFVRAYACYDQAALDGRLVCDWPYPSADSAWRDICTLVEEIRDGS